MVARFHLEWLLSEKEGRLIMKKMLIYCMAMAIMFASIVGANAALGSYE